jgi:predicted phage terminase large subunit-like protein
VNPRREALQTLTHPEFRAEDLAATQLPLLREELRNDLFLFARAVFGFRDLKPELHGRMAQIVANWGVSPEWRRLMFQVPREFFKTSLLTRANSLWQLTREPHLPVAVFNEREQNPKKWGRSMKEVVSGNKLYHLLFPEMCPPGIGPNAASTMPRDWRWRDDMFDLPGREPGEPEASWTGMGTGSGSTGGHWPKIVVDDMIGREAANSDAMMRDAYDFADKLPYLQRPAERGLVMVACTTWTYSDVYTYLIRKYGYVVYKRRALEDGESIFPEKLTTAELLHMQERDPFGFNAQMMLNPMPGRDQSLPPDILRWGSVRDDDFVIETQFYDKSACEAHLSNAPQVIPLSQMHKAILLDPAPTDDRTKDPHSRHGVVVAGMDAWGRRYVLETQATRDEPYELINLLFRLAAKWGLSTVAVEEVVFALIYRHWLQRESRLRDHHLQVVPVKPGRRDKGTRIMGLSPAARSGHVYVNRQSTRPFYQEWIEYPYGETEDVLDAASYMDEVLKRPIAPQERIEMRRRERETVYGRDAITGY